MKLILLVTLPVLAAGVALYGVSRTNAAVPAPVDQLLVQQEQLTGIWQETVEDLAVLVALPQYEFLEEEEQESSNGGPIVSPSGLMRLLEMVL